jgi:hypothetical protein
VITLATPLGNQEDKVFVLPTCFSVLNCSAGFCRASGVENVVVIRDQELGTVATKLNPWEGKNYQEPSLREQVCDVHIAEGAFNFCEYL